MSAHAILRLRGMKYGDEWDGVWRFLEANHDVPRLSLDEAVDQVEGQLSQRHAMHAQRNATILELLRDADRIGLSADHRRRLVGVVAPDEDTRAEILGQAVEHLGWSDIESLETTDATPAPGDVGAWADWEERNPTAYANFAAAMTSVRVDQIPLIERKEQLDIPTCDAAAAADANTVYGEFVMEAPLEDLRYATDPENWPDCSWFFIAMKQQTPKAKLPMPDDVGESAGFDAYECVFEELVGFKFVLTVRTSLTTRYFVGKNSVGMEFDLAPGLHGDGKLSADNGYLLAERHPDDPTKVIVKSFKRFAFVGLDKLPFTFLCEFGWIDMMRQMAHCRPKGGS